MSGFWSRKFFLFFIFQTSLVCAENGNFLNKLYRFTIYPIKTLGHQIASWYQNRYQRDTRSQIDRVNLNSPKVIAYLENFQKSLALVDWKSTTTKEIVELLSQGHFELRQEDNDALDAWSSALIVLLGRMDSPLIVATLDDGKDNLARAVYRTIVGNAKILEKAFAKVVLPTPFFPDKPIISPERKEKLTLLKKLNFLLR